jgi:molybdopterin-guanine dinucleotide biosynthesis protein A
MKPLAGLVLCGGRSTRMGVEKAMLRLDAQPLVLRVAARLAAAADPVMLATGRPGRLGALGYDEVADDLPDAGPLGGVVAGLTSSPHALLAVVAVDMPMASPDVARLLAELHVGEDALVPRSRSGPEPLHAVYHRAALPALRACLTGGPHRMREVLSRLRVREVTEAEWRAADPDARFAVNVNTPEDLTGVSEVL